MAAVPSTPGLVRTAVPITIALLVENGLDGSGIIDSETLTLIVAGVITWVYYLGVRILERVSTTKWGWLLGYASAPEYTGEHGRRL